MREHRLCSRRRPSVTERIIQRLSRLPRAAGVEAFAGILKERFVTDGSIVKAIVVIMESVCAHSDVFDAASIACERVSTDGGILLTNFIWASGIDGVAKERVKTDGRVRAAGSVPKERTRAEGSNESRSSYAPQGNQ